MVHVIIKGKNLVGKTRSEQEENMRKEWGFTINDEQLDKLKFLEKGVKEKFGLKKNFITGIDIDKVK